MVTHTLRKAVDNADFTALQGDFATVESTTTASKAYDVGDYLVLNSFLYKVITAIAAGGTINTAIGGNVMKTDVDSMVDDKFGDNAYLAPSGDNTDRTADILALLTNAGVCRLGKGDYYVSNIDMPTGTAIIGSGYQTRIVLSGTTEGYAIKMTNYCSVKDVQIVGKTSLISLSETVGGRHGILWQGNYTQDQTADNQPRMGKIENVDIFAFTGGGITCYDTGYGTFNALEVVNAYINNCNVGINIPYWSEFHKFTNVRTASCYHGCINNGGNNTFVNCDFSTCKIGFLMDNSTGQSPNNSHGQCVGCVFNHADNNNGIGIKVLNCDAGFIFDACQIFFSQIYIDESDGVVVSNCNFGANNCNITISGGGAMLFANNMHQSAPTITITNNSNVHFVNCYVRATGASVAPS